MEIHPMFYKQKLQCSHWSISLDYFHSLKTRGGDRETNNPKQITNWKFSHNLVKLRGKKKIFHKNLISLIFSNNFFRMKKFKFFNFSI